MGAALHLVGCALALTGLGGTLLPPEGGIAEPPAGMVKPGVVFVVGGVGGLGILGPVAHWKLPQAGVAHEVRDFVWTHGRGQIFKDLQDAPYLVAQAEELARQVQAVKEKEPERPVYMIGRSGGAGVVLAAAGMLPPNMLERIVLLSAAVSPTYDLRLAFRATKGPIVSFYSRHDWFTLGWGTTQFGTMDRVYGASAGKTGFVVPADLSPHDRALYQRLEQIPWSSNMILEGHLGMHHGTSMPGFISKEVAPWLKP
jgi:pimeloyl-ACP methyl ester carboxylesterase